MNIAILTGYDVIKDLVHVTYDNLRMIRKIIMKADLLIDSYILYSNNYL